jgi:hypothetical protein
MLIKYFKFFFKINIPWLLFVVHTSCGPGVSVICNNGLY